MKINRKLNLVTTVSGESGLVHFHSTPISVELFERYFLPISKTFAAIYQEGLSITAGPRVAALMLRKVSEDMGVWEGPEGVKDGLMEEIKRLTLVLANTGKGWQMLPIDVAVAQNLIDPEDVTEALGGIVFFTLASSVHKRTMVKGVLNSMCGLWGQEVTLQTATEYLASLRTSTPVENSGVTLAQELPPAEPSLAQSFPG